MSTYYDLFIFSTNGRQVLFGMEDGAIRIHNLDIEFDIATISYSWALNVHDNNYGHLTGVKLGYDSLNLITVGADGNFFMFDVMTQENIDKKVEEAKAKLPSAKVSFLTPDEVYCSHRQDLKISI